MLITVLMTGEHVIYAFNHDDPVLTILVFCKMRYYIIQSSSMMIYRWNLSLTCFDHYALSSSNVRLTNFFSNSYCTSCNINNCIYLDNIPN